MNPFTHFKWLSLWVFFLQVACLTAQTNPKTFEMLESVLRLPEMHAVLSLEDTAKSNLTVRFFDQTAPHERIGKGKKSAFPRNWGRLHLRLEGGDLPFDFNARTYRDIVVATWEKKAAQRYNVHLYVVTYRCANGERTPWHFEISLKEKEGRYAAELLSRAVWH